MKATIAKLEKLAFVLPVTYQNQKVETRMESLWVFFSDAGTLRRWWVMYPKNPQNVFIRRKG